MEPVVKHVEFLIGGDQTPQGDVERAMRSLGNDLVLGGRGLIASVVPAMDRRYLPNAIYRIRAEVTITYTVCEECSFADEAFSWHADAPAERELVAK